MNKCNICKKDFKPIRKEQIFCSHKCFGIYNRKRILWKCNLCDYTEYKIRCRARTSKYCKNCCKGARYKGSLNGNWKGGFKMHVDGYKYIYKPDHPFSVNHKYIMEHRLIFEKHLGRYLKSNEVIHHINENRLDNRIQNLKLYQSGGKHVAENHVVRNRLGQFTSHS